MVTSRRADVVWEGDLLTGRGDLTGTSSGALRDQPVSWNARTQAPARETSPEELIAAAHASCFAMALSAGLAKRGTPGQRLEVSATVALDKSDGGYRISSSALEVRGWAPGLAADAFEEAAEAAKEQCPVSQALKPGVAITVRAELKE